MVRWKERPLTPLEAEVGILLVALRLASGETQREVADATGLYVSRICEAETIKRAVSVEFLEKYAAGLGCRVKVSLVPLEEAP